MSLSVFALYFSPTGNTQKAVRAVAEGIADIASDGDYYAIDLTSCGDRFSVYDFGPEDVVVLGMPTYAGRIPNKIMPYVEESIYGNGAIAVPVVTYGNRSYDDSLKELATIMTENGMKLTAAVSVPAEHAFSDKLAASRPSDEDLDVLREYGRKVGEKIKKGASIIEVSTLPGRNLEESTYYKPLRVDGQPANFLKAMVNTDIAKCDGCGECRRICPMGCFEESVCEPVGICIKCHGCVHSCPKGAKYFGNEDLASHITMLENNYGTIVKEIEVYGV